MSQTFRALTVEELNFVSGGTYIPGVGWDIEGTPGTWGDFGGPYGTNPSGATGGSGSDGRSGPNGTHVNMQGLSPHHSIDMSDMRGIQVSFDGINLVQVWIDNKTVPQQDYRSANNAQMSLFSAIGTISTNYSKLSIDAQAALHHVKNIILIDTPRSFSEEKTGTFFFDKTEILAESTAFAASNIIHDARHIRNYDTFGNLADSRGVDAEVAGWRLQVENASALGLTAHEVDHLNQLIANPSSQDTRMNTPPY